MVLCMRTRFSYCKSVENYVIIYMYPEYMKQEEIMKDNFVPEAIIEKLRDIAKTRELPEAEKEVLIQAGEYIQRETQPALVPFNRLVRINEGKLPAEPVYMESRFYPCVEDWAVVVSRYTTEGRIIFALGGPEHRITPMTKRDYLWGWRCWTGKPTEEQMKNTPWKRKK